jgi:hypothetical protein
MGTKSERGWGLIRATKEKGEKRKKKEQKKWRGSCWAAIRRERGKEAKKKKGKKEVEKWVGHVSVCEWLKRR